MLNVSGFKLRRTIEFDPKFMDPEYPFRWAGVYHLTGEFYDLRLYGVPFPKVKMVMLSLPEGSGIDELRDDVTLLFSGNETHVPHGSRILPGRKLLQLQTKEGESVFGSRSIRPDATCSLWKRVSSRINLRFVERRARWTWSRCRSSNRITSGASHDHSV